jgi:C4-dicarboxylate-binding protein DctP
MAKGTWLYAFVALAVSASVCSAEAEPVTLRFTLQVAASNPQLGLPIVQFKEEVEGETKKAVVIEIYDKQRLYIDDQVVGAVQSGAVEMGMAGINQITKRLPAAEILELPFLFNFTALTHASADPERELRKLLDAAVLEAIGVRVLWLQTGGNHVLFGKGLDVADPERMSNKKVRVYSSSMANMIKHCGGVPEILSITKVHKAFKDDTIDLAMTGILSAETRDLWQVSDTVTRTDIASMEWFIIMNEKSWQALTDQQRATMQAAAKRAERDVREKSVRLEEKSWKWARNKGMKVHDLTPDQVAEWRACSAEVIEKYMSSGGELVRKLMLAYGKLRADPCCSVGPAGAFTRR